MGKCRKRKAVTPVEDDSEDYSFLCKNVKSEKATPSLKRPSSDHLQVVKFEDTKTKQGGKFDLKLSPKKLRIMGSAMISMADQLDDMSEEIESLKEDLGKRILYCGDLEVDLEKKNDECDSFKLKYKHYLDKYDETRDEVADLERILQKKRNESRRDKATISTLQNDNEKLTDKVGELKTCYNAFKRMGDILDD